MMQKKETLVFPNFKLLEVEMVGIPLAEVGADGKSLKAVKLHEALATFKAATKKIVGMEPVGMVFGIMRDRRNDDATTQVNEVEQK